MTNISNQPPYPPAQKPIPYNGQAMPRPVQAGQAVTGATPTPQTYVAPNAHGMVPPVPQAAPQTYATPAGSQPTQGTPMVQSHLASQLSTTTAHSTMSQANTQSGMTSVATPSAQGRVQVAQQGQTYSTSPQPTKENSELTDRDREFEKEDKKLYHKRTRIVKFATNKTYFEVFNFGFKHGRIAIKMSNYKPQYSEILISLKFGEYFELKDLIMSGAIHHRQPDKYGNLHFYNKGTASKYSKDGSVSARQLGIQRANDPSKYVVTFIAKEGPGKQDQKGLIQFIGKPNTTVIYPMTRAMLVELFDTVDIHLQGYLNACYQYQFQSFPNFTKES